MLQKYEKDIILRCAKKYDVSSIILFGSSAKKDRDYNDIDIGVKGLRPELFFRFYAELIKYLPKRVDLINLSRRSLLNDIVEEEGVKIYG